MINPTKTNIYKLSSKRYLIKLLKIPNRTYLNQKYVAKQIDPYIQSEPKSRLIEAPSESLKKIQRNLKKELMKIEVPFNVFSGIKGKSYIDNADVHKDCKFLFKIDLSAFFPCITRETVYRFFLIDLKVSPDIAKILTNFVTVDLTLCDIQNQELIEEFLLCKGIKTANHLISGAPTSQILSYLVNHKMFDELQLFSDNNNIVMSIYVDDITFSSQHRISHKQKEIIYKIISKHLYRLSRSKVKYYTNNYPKLVTGAVISSDNTLIVPNSLRNKVIKALHDYKKSPQNTNLRKRLRGLVIAARQIEPTEFESIYNLVYDASK